MAQTSLAAQLNSLRIAQKDQVALPSRTKLSFLFDIKQAANIDDQTLYYICIGGLTEIEQQIPALSTLLQVFMQDIFHQKSVEFYRGTETKQTLQGIDEKLELIIKILSPYFLYQNTHKVLEYLIRVYEVNAYHKHTLIYSFLPYFETAFFLRLIQTLNLKDDDYFKFLNDFAYKGEALDKKILIRALARNDALLFSKYADFCFELSKLHTDMSQTPENSLHWKFLGATMVDVLKTSETSQTLMFSILPFVAQSLKASLRELKTAGLLAISQICSRKTISVDYSIAFIQQIIQSLKEASLEDEFIEQGLLVIMIICQYQRVDFLTASDINTLLGLPRVKKGLSKLTNNYDTSPLYKLIAQSYLYQVDVDLKAIKTFFSNSLNLKSLYRITESVIFKIVSDGDLQERGTQILTLIQELNLPHYNQSILHLLKQEPSQEQKDKILHVLQNGSQSQHLVAKFGDKEYSLLSAIGSQQKQTKLNALKAISGQGLMAKLSQREKDLIKLSLVQILSRASDDESVTELVVNALQTVMDAGANNDSEFDTLEQFYHDQFAVNRYSQELLSKVQKVALSITTHGEEQQIKSMIWQLLTSSFDKVPQSYKYLSVSETKAPLIVTKMLQNLEPSLKLILSAFKLQRSYYNYETIIELMQQLAIQSKEKSHEQELLSFYSQLLTSLKGYKQVKPEQILKAIINGIPTKAKTPEEQLRIDKCFSKVIGLILVFKSRYPDFPLSLVHTELYSKYLNSNVQKLAEFYVKIALGSKNEQKIVFALISLTNIVKHKHLSPSIMIIAALVSLYSEFRSVREHTLHLIEGLTHQYEHETQIVELFANTPKPQSSKKDLKQKADFTPLKGKPAKTLLKDILKLSAEIKADRQQLKTAMSQQGIQKHLEVLVRSLLDLPSTTIKIKFLEILSLAQSHSLIFSMSLSDQLGKEYFQLKQKPVINEDDCAYLAEIAKLISRICSSSDQAAEENISSLIFNYLLFIHGVLEAKVPLEKSLDESIGMLFLQNLLKSGVITSLKQGNLVELLRYYIKAQIFVFAKKVRDQIKDALIQSTDQALSASEFQPILVDALDKLRKATDVMPSDIEVILETLISLKLTKSVQMLPTLVDIIQEMSKKSQQFDVTFHTELIVQISLSVIDQEAKSKAKIDSGEIIKSMQQILDSELTDLSNLIQGDLEKSDSDKHDPFKEFLMQVDDNKQEPVEKNREMMTVFQLMSSIFKLLNSTELQFNHSLSKTDAFLSSIATLLKDLTEHAKIKTSTGLSILSQVFRFYHQLVLRTSKTQIPFKVDMKQILATFIDSAVELQDFNATVDETVVFVLSVLESQGHKECYSFVQLILLCHAQDRITVKDNMELDSFEIQMLVRIIIQNKDPLETLVQLEQLLFLITALPLADKQSDYLKTKLSLLFDSEVVQERVSVVDWVRSRYLTESKTVRKLKYIALYIFNDWFKNNQSLQKSLAVLTHSKKLADQVFAIFYRIYLSTSLLNDQVQSLLQSKEYEDNKTKKSVKRLIKRVQEFQSTFNQMLSYDVHVSIVLKVLDFSDKQTTTLKTNTLQLLINKMPPFYQMGKAKESEMVGLFQNLVVRCLEILAAMQKNISNTAKKGSQDNQAYVQALFSIVGRASSTFLSQETREQSIQLVLEYLEKAPSLTLLLHSQLILTVMTLFEVYQTDILEFLPQYFNFVTLAFDRLRQVAESQDFFQDSFYRTLLKASLSICTFFSKFLNATQFETMIKNVIVVPAQYEPEVKAILDVLSKETLKNVGLKLVFQAMFNSFESVLIDQGIQQSLLTSNLSQVSLRFFDNLVKEVIMRMKKDFCADNYKKVFLFFKAAMTFPVTYYIQNESTDIPQIDAIEDSIVQCFSQFAVKLNEDMLRNLIVKLIKWATKKKEGAFPYSMHKMIITYKVLNGLLETLKEFFVPLQNLYLEKSLDILKTLIEIFSGIPKQDKKRSRADSLIHASPDGGHSLHKLLILSITNFRLNFVYDSISFIQNDTFEKLSPSLSELVSIVSIDNYLDFVEQTLKPSIFDIVDRINNDDMWKKLNYEVLLKTRSDNWQIRLGAFKVIENLFQRIGERYLVLLNDTLPFLSEGMEDENNNVEQTAKAIVSRIEQLTGDSIQEYLK